VPCCFVQATATDEDEESAEDNNNNDDEDVFAAEALLSVSLLRRDGSSRADGSAMTTAEGEGKPRRARKLSAKAAALAELEAQEPPQHAGQAREHSLV